VTVRLLVAALGAIAIPAHAIEFKPTLEAEARYFYEAPDSPLPASASATLEVFHGWQDGKQRIVGELFQRYDDTDDARTHGDVRELYYQVIGDDFEYRLGARRVYWGVTESRHLVDIVNQSDLVEDIDLKAKLGQPMMSLALIRDLGTLDLMLLPYARARTFPGPEGWPRLPFPVAANEAMYESRQGQHRLDFAARWTGSAGPVDFGVAWFDGSARDPRLLPCLKRGSRVNDTEVAPNGPNCDIASAVPGPGATPEQLIPLLQMLGLAPSNEEVAREIYQSIVLVPFYDRLRQASIDGQYVTGSLAVKLEALRREQQDRATWAAVAGLEYTFGDVWGSGADVGILGEYLYDQKDDFLGVLFDDEVFVGGRLAVNDVAGTSVLAGVIGNRETFRNRLFSVEASRRLTDDWRVSLKARMFAEMPDDSVASFLENQDFATLMLEWFL
jgi:hypothetical protein